MSGRGLSISALFRQTWEVYKKNWIFLTGILLVSLILFGAVAWLPEYFLFKPTPFVSAILQVIAMIFSLWIFLGQMKIFIKLAKGEEARFSDLFTAYPQILNYLVAYFLITLFVIVAIGVPVSGVIYVVDLLGANVDQWLAEGSIIKLLLAWIPVLALVGLVIFVFYILIRWMLAPYFIVERYEGPIEAIRHSYHATKGVVIDLFVLMLVVLSMSVLGVLFYGIGLFITYPFHYLMQSAAYHELKDR